jgi:methionyl-tRNA synthetase
LCERGNKLFDHAEPWRTIKEDKKRTKEILMDFLYLSYNLRILLSPFLPSCEERLSKYLGVGRVLPKEGFNTWKPSMPTVVRLSPSLAPLFSKIEREVIEQEHVRPTP